VEKTFEIKLPQFEGPFDLLLFFIERDELDIHNIPIATITNDFLSYVHEMNELNIEVASEFILVAATLMRIKAKMLLPRPELDEQGNEIDPRQDLIEKLLLYKQYKAVQNEFRGLEDDRSLISERGNVIKELNEMAKNTVYADELTNLSLYQLLTTFQKVMKRFEVEQNKPKHTVVQFPYTLRDTKSKLYSKITLAAKTTFVDVLMECENKVHAIFSFLGILELLQEQLIFITIGEGFNNFWLTSSAPPIEVNN
jgi:segregation and condensation protein A